MKTITMNVGVSGFRKHIRLPKDLHVADHTTVIDLIAILDRQFYEEVRLAGKALPTDFYWKEMHSLLQLFWNPEIQQFYDDVGIEAWTPETKPIAVEKDWKTTIPDQSWVYFTPDAGC